MIIKPRLTANLHWSGELQETRLVEENISCHQAQRSDLILGKVDLRAWPLTLRRRESADDREETGRRRRDAARLLAIHVFQPICIQHDNDVLRTKYDMQVV